MKLRLPVLIFYFLSLNCVHYLFYYGLYRFLFLSLSFFYYFLPSIYIYLLSVFFSQTNHNALFRQPTISLLSSEFTILDPSPLFPVWCAAAGGALCWLKWMVPDFTHFYNLQMFRFQQIVLVYCLFKKNVLSVIIIYCYCLSTRLVVDS